MVRQLFSPTVRWSDSSIVRHNRNYITISVARKTRYMYDYGMVTYTMSPLSRFTAHLLPVYRATYK